MKAKCGIVTRVMSVDKRAQCAFLSCWVGHDEVFCG